MNMTKAIEAPAIQTVDLECLHLDDAAMEQLIRLMIDEGFAIEQCDARGKYFDLVRPDFDIMVREKTVRRTTMRLRTPDEKLDYVLEDDGGDWRVLSFRNGRPARVLQIRSSSAA
jgi:hypothetical protein